MLTLRLSALRHPDIGHLLQKFVKSGIEGSKLPLRMIDSARMARHPATGLFIPSLVEIPLDDKRLARILKNIVRALYFHEHKRVLDEEYQYRIFELPDTAINGWINFFPEAGLRPYREIGDGQVEYQHGRFTHDMDTTIWTLCFFGGVWYGGLTLPPNVSSRAEIAGHLFPHLLADDALVSTDDEAS